MEPGALISPLNRITLANVFYEKTKSLDGFENDVAKKGDACLVVSVNPYPGIEWHPAVLLVTPFSVGRSWFDGRYQVVCEGSETVDLEKV